MTFVIPEITLFVNTDFILSLLVSWLSIGVVAQVFYAVRGLFVLTSEESNALYGEYMFSSMGLHLFIIICWPYAYYRMLAILLED